MMQRSLSLFYNVYLFGCTRFDLPLGSLGPPLVICLALPVHDFICQFLCFKFFFSFFFRHHSLPFQHMNNHLLINLSLFVHRAFSFFFFFFSLEIKP